MIKLTPTPLNFAMRSDENSGHILHVHYRGESIFTLGWETLTGNHFRNDGFELLLDAVLCVGVDMTKLIWQ